MNNTEELKINESMLVFCSQDRNGPLSGLFLCGDKYYVSNGFILLCLEDEKLRNGMPISDGVEKRLIDRLPSDHFEKDFNFEPILITPNEQCHVCCGVKYVSKVDGVTCNECDGHGSIFFESNKNKYDVECRSCYGSGFYEKETLKPDVNGDYCPYCLSVGMVIKNHSTNFNDLISIYDKVYFQSKYLIALTHHLENVKIQTNIDSPTEPIRIIFTGGYGIIMPVRAIDSKKLNSIQFNSEVKQ